MDTTADAYLYAGVRMMGEYAGSVLAVLKDVAIVVIAGATLWVVRRQWQTDERRLKHEQYERRAQVFRGVGAYLSIVAMKGKIDVEDLHGWARATSEKEFLFGAEINGFIEEVRQRSITYMEHDRELRETPVDHPSKAALAQRRADELTWFHNEASGLKDRFAPYLRIT